MTCEENNALVHFGIKGQKWGVRRFQNEDRTLTEEGKKRYSVGSGNESKDAKIYSKEVKKYNKLRDKADIDLQRQKSEKHQRNAEKAAKVSGTLGVAALGAAAGLGGLANYKRFVGDTKYEFSELYKNGASQADYRGLMKNIYEREADDAYKAMKGFQNAAIYTSAGLLSASFVAACVAGQQKARSVIEKRRTTPIGHAKVTAKLEKQYNKMIDMFGNTPYKALVEALPKKKN